MFLKRLELQGFKSFATRTEFEFNGGITAIVGPNGVGKSNITDALRWVLGEQSGRLLRTRRLEDVIFSGGARRAPTAMAEVTVVFDNSTGNFPIDFTELAITRRAYRSGESEYYINGNKSLFRDVIGLLMKGNLGRDTYTIMGQGLVDVVLSQRPEDRRSLFEDAADVRRHRVKLDEAQQKLTATLRNLERINYVMGELKPRLRRLEGQVNRAREHEGIATELSAILRQWYELRMWDSKSLLDIAKNRHIGTEREFGEVRERVSTQETALSQLRERRRFGQRGLEESLRRREALRQREQELSQSLAVDGQRLSIITQQREEMLEEIAALDKQRGIQEDEGKTAQERWLELEEVMKKHAGDVASLEQRLGRLESRHNESSASRAASREQVLEQATKLANLRSRLEQLEERRAELAADHESWRGEKEALTKEKSMQEQRLEEVTGRVRSLALEVEGVEREQQEILRQRDESRQAVEQHRTVLQRAQQEEEKLRIRIELVSQLRSQAEGVRSGVQFVLQAAEAGQGSVSRPPEENATSTPEKKLRGIVGTVASIVEVPTGLEAAIEAALEGQLQDIVVQTWEHAEAAVAFLKKNDAGRVNFLPLQSLREGRPLQLGAERGVVGVAAKLVRCAPRYQKVVDILLGRVIVVENMEAALKMLPRGLGSVVTLSGELIRPLGSLSGGSRGEGRSLMEWERDWRELPNLLNKLEEEATALSARLETESERCRSYEKALGTVEEQVAHLRGRQQTDESEEADLRQRIGEIDRELALRNNLTEKMERESETLRRRREALVAEEGEIVAASASLQKTAESLDEQIGSLEEERSTVRKGLEEARTDLALTEGERNNRRSLWASFEANLKNLQTQVETRTARARRLEEESSALTSRLSSARDEHEKVLTELTPLEEKLAPLRDGLTGVDDEESSLTQELESLRPRLTQLQQTLAQAQIEESQAQEEWRRLCSSMEEDGIALPQDISPPDESLPDAAELERRIKRLRGRLGSIGSVDAETIKDYEETKSRHEFLSSQVNDLQKTEQSLQDAITELKGIIEVQFVETFNKLGEEFSHYFTIFFGGGSAKLILTQPDNPVESGIDIVARPPGKRLQNLAALSGGERALTGTALLFAMLRANPAPFCVLDEVDAALDDANIIRFAGALKGLSEQTQFILITHNRGTMEVADALYGVSMDDDSASTVLSLRLNGRGQAA